MTVPLPSEGKKILFNDWYAYTLSFLPMFTPVDQKSIVQNVTNFTTQLFGNFGQLYGTEAYKSTTSKQILWGATSIRFKYPAEHIIQNTTYDLEMQVMLVVSDYRLI